MCYLYLFCKTLEDKDPPVHFPCRMRGLAFLKGWFWQDIGGFRVVSETPSWDPINFLAGKILSTMKGHSLRKISML